MSIQSDTESRLMSDLSKLDDKLDALTRERLAVIAALQAYRTAFSRKDGRIRDKDFPNVDGSRVQLVASAPTQSRKSPTIKEMIVHVLGETESGATSEELLDLIEHRFDQRLVRTSMSPQLSRLRHQDGKVELDKSSGKWRLVETSDRTAQLTLEPQSPAAEFLETSSEEDDGGENDG